MNTRSSKTPLFDARFDSNANVILENVPLDYCAKYHKHLKNDKKCIIYNHFLKPKPCKRKEPPYHNVLPVSAEAALSNKCIFATLIQCDGIPSSVPWNGEETVFPANFTFPCLAKPANGSQGIGIVLINDAKDLVAIPKKSKFVLSSYVPNLLLHDGKKMHLRLFILIKPFERKVWLYKKGICLSAKESYESLSNKEANFTSVHITNGCPNPIKSDVPLQDKEDLVFDRLGAILNRVFRAWFQCFSFSDDKMFSIFGIDVLIDTNFWPHLLEFNPKWSMEVHNADEEVKCKQMFPDFLRLVRNTSDASKNCILVYS